MVKTSSEIRIKKAGTRSDKIFFRKGSGAILILNYALDLNSIFDNIIACSFLLLQENIALVATKLKNKCCRTAEHKIAHK